VRRTPLIVALATVAAGGALTVVVVSLDAPPWRLAAGVAVAAGLLLLGALAIRGVRGSSDVTPPRVADTLRGPRRYGARRSR